MTSRGRVKLVATLPASFASGAVRTGGYPWLSSPPPAGGYKRGLDVTFTMKSAPATGDKRSALDALGTFDDDGCAEQGDGTAAAGPKPEQGEMSNKAGASSTVLEGRFGNEKVGERNVALGTHAALGGGARRQKRGRVVRELGREARSSKTRQRGMPREAVRRGRVGMMGFLQVLFILRRPRCNV
jgi:hypothetical protein